MQWVMVQVGTRKMFWYMHQNSQLSTPLRNHFILLTPRFLANAASFAFIRAAMTALADFLTTAAYGFSFISALIFVRGLRLTEARRTSFLDNNHKYT